MRRIAGIVQVKESGLGVPNLLVAAYDSNESRAMPPTKFADKSFRIDSLGKRIGSTLTDQEGRFALRAEELEFTGNESRPDLLLVILAPEDVQSVERPYPLPPERRVLYMSAAPVFDAGAEEATVIRLRQKQLDSFQISSDPAAVAGGSQASRYASNVESTWAFADTLRPRLSSRLRKDQAKAAQRAKLARSKLANLSALPAHVREGTTRNNALLIVGKEELASQLNKKQTDSITDGLRRMRKSRKVVRLLLSPSDLRDLDLKREGNRLRGKVDPEKLASKTRELLGGLDLVRVRTFSNPDPDELQAKYLASKPSTTTPKRPGGQRKK